MPVASRGKRWLIGCGLGCAVLIALVIAAVIGFFVWVRGSGELLEPQTLLGADTTGYVEWTLQLEDPGTEGFARGLIAAVQSLPPEASEELPPWLLNWLARQQSKEAEQDILELFPMVTAWTLHPGEAPGDDLHLISLSIRRFGHRLVVGDWIIGWVLPRAEEVAVERYRNEKIYRIPIKDEAGVTFFIRHGNLFFTSDADTARLAVDRLIASAAPREPGELDRMFAATEGALRGAIGNERGEMLRLWQWISSPSDTPVDPQLWNGFRGVALSGGLKADGSLAATLRFHGPDRGWAETRALDLVTALYDGLAWTDLGVDIQARPFDEGLEVELRIPELTEAIGHWMRDAREIETDSGRVRIDL
jgi:hypothetical protein